MEDNIKDISSSIEVLNHFRCASCEKWWSIADIKFALFQAVYCPHCGQQHSIKSIQNGKQKEVAGIAWLLLPEKAS